MFDSPDPQWSEPPESPEPEPSKRDRRPAWQVALVSAAAALVVLLIADVVLGAFGLMRIGRTTEHRPGTVAPSSAATTVPAASQVSSRIELPDKLAGHPRIPHTPSPADFLAAEVYQTLEANGISMTWATYGGTEQDPLLELSVLAFPPGNNMGRQMLNGMLSGGYQSFNHDAVTFHCHSAVTPTSSSSGPAHCLFYYPKGGMLVSLMSNAISWGDARRLSELAARVSRFLDQA